MNSKTCRRTARTGYLFEVFVIGHRVDGRGQTRRMQITCVFLRDTDVRLTLYLRDSGRLTNPDPKRVTIVEGDVLDQASPEPAMRGQDVVFANLAGAMKPG